MHQTARVAEDECRAAGDARRWTTTECEDREKYAPWNKKMTYQPMLQIPDEPWRVDASWRDAYSSASKERR